MVTTTLLFLSQQSNPFPTITYSFPAFNSNNFAASSEAVVRQDALQIKPDSGNHPGKTLVDKAGRVLLSRLFKIWDFHNTSNTTIKHVASFTTSFDMNVMRFNGTIHGEGLAFIVTPDSGNRPPGTHGGYLGLTNSTHDGLSSNNFVAVEFDTFQQSYDPNDNHVGLNINSIVSNTNTSLGSFGIEISPFILTNWTVWIDYNGTHRHISVYMNTSSSPKPAEPVLNASLDLSVHLPQWSYFGFSASTGTNYELNCILALNLTIEDLLSDLSPGKARRPVQKYGLAATVTSVAVVVVGVFRLFVLEKEESGQLPNKHDG